MAKTQHQNTNGIPRRPRNQLIPPSMHSSQKQLLRPLHSLPRSSQHNRTSSQSLTGNSPHPPTTPRPQPPSPSRFHHVLAAAPAQPASAQICRFARGLGSTRVEQLGRGCGSGRGGAGRGRVGWVLGQAAAGVERKMKKKKVEAEEVLRPFISLKGRREGPFGAGGVLDEGGKGGEAGSDKDGEVAEVGREDWYLNGLPEN